MRKIIISPWFSISSTWSVSDLAFKANRFVVSLIKRYYLNRFIDDFKLQSIDFDEKETENFFEELKNWLRFPDLIMNRSF